MRRLDAILMLSARPRVLFFLLLAGALLAPLSAGAQQTAVNLTVSPSSLDLTTTPGATITDRIRVRNNSSRPLALRVKVEKVVPTSDEAGLTIQEAAPSDEFLQWVHFAAPTFTAQPGEWIDIPFTLTTPPQAAFGYYFAFVITPAEEGSEGNVALSAGVAVLGALKVQVPGAIAAAELVSFKPTHVINEWLPADFTVTVRNTGNIHIKPRGNIFIQRGDGSPIALLEVNPALANVLPGAIRTFSTSWSDGFFTEEPVMKDGAIEHDKNGQPRRHLVIHWNKLTEFRLGKYTAHLLMVYDTGERDATLEGETTFWVIPYKLIGGLLLGFILALIILRQMLRTYVRRQVKKSQRWRR